MKSAATDRQRDVLEIIETTRDERGYSPSIREISAVLDVSSTNATADLLKALRKRGLVEWMPRTARTLRVTEDGLRELRRGGR